MDRNHYLNLDDQDVLEWEDKVPFQPYQYLGDYDTPHPIPWKGGLWSVKWRINQKDSRGFVGLNQCKNLPDDWQLRFKYKFGLCPLPEFADTEDIIWTETSQHTFIKPEEDYIDHSILSLKSASYIQSNSRIFITEDQCIILKCRLEAIPIPFAVHQGYNSKVSTGMVGLQNLGATCYLNALLQMLYHVNFFRKGVYQIPFENEEIQESTTLALQSVFHKLQMDVGAVSTFDLTKAFGWNTFEAFQQQDVQEMMRVLLDKLEERMKSTPADGVIQKLFVGKVKSYIRCIQIDYESSREEDFYDLQLDVRGCKDIYESFTKYIAKETLTGENQYDAGEDRGKQDAEKGVQFSTLPPVLTIHLKRFEFDMQRMGFSKIHDRYEFPLRLDLNKYVSSSEDVENSQNIYHLHSVLVHSGDVSGGHYTAFIRPSVDTFWEKVSTNPTPDSRTEYDGKWYQFDDDIVTPADRREAVEMCYGSGSRRGSIARDFSSAYMLVYLRESEAPQLMKSVSIPIELSARLNQEKLKKVQETLHHKHQESFMEVDYFLETDIHNFCGYCEGADLITEKQALKQLKILKGSNYLGLLNQFARELKRLPCEIEIWKAYRKNETRIRVYDSIPPTDYLLPIKDLSYYFVRFVEETNTQLIQELDDLLLKESGFINALRQRYCSTLPEALTLKFDPCESCGIGRGGTILRNFTIASQTEDNEECDPINFDLVTIPKKRLIQYYHDLCDKEIEILSQSRCTCEEDDALIFLRAYDVERNWVLSGIQKQKILIDEDSDSESSESSDEVSLNNSEDLDPNHRTRRIIYLGCLKVNSSHTYLDLENEFSTLLHKFYDENRLHFPPSWSLLQFVNISTTSDVAQFEYTPTKSLEELGIQAGDILYCFPVKESETLAVVPDENLTLEKTNQLFFLNPYVKDIQSFFENETTKVKFLVKIHKYFDYVETVNRMSGIWTFSSCPPSPGRMISQEGILISLSVRKRCSEIISQLEDHFHVSNENRLMVGKYYVAGNVPHFRQLRNQENDLTLNEFVWINTRTPKYMLSLVLLPFEINDYLINNQRYLEFQLCDFRLKSRRSQWLKKFIYPQASELYKIQIKELLEGNFSLTDHINRGNLFPISQSLVWPENITPLPDEWILEDKLFLKFQDLGDDELNITDILNEVKEQIFVDDEKNELCRKRQRSQTVSDDSGSESKSDDSSWINRKRLKSDSKKFVSRGEFESSPQLEKNDSFFEEEQYPNPFLFSESPWEAVLYLTEHVHLSGTSEDDWGGPYLLLFEIHENKVGKLFRPRSTLSSFPKSWMEVFFDERFANPTALGVQLVTTADWIYMSGLAYPKFGIRSIPISIFSFELSLSGIADSLNHQSKPVLSYVREDDTLDTLIDRVGSLTGEVDWERIVLVNQAHRIVEFPVSSPISGSGCNSEDEMCEGENIECHIPPTYSIWNLYEKYYPEYTSRDSVMTLGSLPLLGIQRSTRLPREPEALSRFKKQTGIKIRG